MDHIAIMRKSWGLTQKILSNEKTLEERWYKTKRAPWDMAKTGDNIYFKDSGQAVSIKAKITKVLQFENLTLEKSEEIVRKYANLDIGAEQIPKEIKEYVSGKNYCVIVFFDKVEKITSFEIDKTGFGAMSAWICIDNVNKIKK
ncbi:MAG: hypothetical protein PHW31_00985 [Candidatus Pacebacteria bacterium]|nr:hypothetical protein [Candidatus Paceibacterota bacterium]